MMIELLNDFNHVTIIRIPHSNCDWYYNECNQRSDISQSIGLQGSHFLVEAEVVRHIESQGTCNARHLNCHTKHYIYSIVNMHMSIYALN